MLEFVSKINKTSSQTEFNYHRLGLGLSNMRANPEPSQALVKPNSSQALTKPNSSACQASLAHVKPHSQDPYYIWKGKRKEPQMS